MATIDISRRAFDPRKHYTSVRMQQGRVITDDDWNENERIANEDQRRSRVHIIGPAGSPDDGFRIADPRSNGDDLIEFNILAGTFYIGGLRLEMEETQTYRTQSDLLQWPSDQQEVPTEERFDLVYLEAYQEPVGAVEDSELFEVALGGPDTSMRMRTVQRVILCENIPAADCAQAWQVLKERWAARNMGTLNENELVPDVQLTVTFEPGGDPGDLCTPLVAGGYLGAENQAIRVQLVRRHYLTWGFDNGTPLYRVEAAADGTTLTMLTEPKDQAHWPQADQIVEILPWSAVLPNGEKLAEGSGHLSRVETSYDPTTRHLTLTSEIPSPTHPDGWRYHGWGSRDDADKLEESGVYYFMRVWDRGSDRTSESEIFFTLGRPVTLGHTGLQVTITGPDPSTDPDLLSGDYWIIAARSETPDHVVPWELERGRRPHGVRRFYAPLALIHWGRGVNEGQTLWGQPFDCRAAFLPAVDWLAAIRPRTIQVFPAVPGGEAMEVVNGATIDADTLSQGLRIVLDRNVRIERIGREVCDVALRLPMRETEKVSGLEGDSVIGYHPLVLDATATLRDPTNVLWTPTAPAAAFLRQRLRDQAVPRPFLEDWEVIAPVGHPAACSYEGAEAVELRWETLPNTPHRTIAIARSPLSANPYCLGLTSQVSTTNGSIGIVFNWESSESYSLLECSWYWQPVSSSGAIAYIVVSLAEVHNGAEHEIHRTVIAPGSTPTEVALAIKQCSDGLSMKASMKVRDTLQTCEIDTSTIANAPRTFLANTQVGMLASAWITGGSTTAYTTRFSRLEVVYPFDRAVLIPPLTVVPATLTLKHRFLPPEETTPRVPHWQPDSEVWFWVATPQEGLGYGYGYPYGECGALGPGSENL